METQTIIPLFESNQILSSTHLNQLREYLEDEIRYSRTMLSGVGIVTGLNLKSFDNTTVVITPGYGITTDGYLLDLPCSLGDANEEISYTRFQPYYDPMLPEYNFGNSATDSNWDESGASAKNTQAKAVQKNPLPDPTMFELFTADKTKYDKDAFDIKDFDSKTKLKIADMTVVLFGEFEDVDLKNCTGTNCDNKGKKRVVTMRVLLVPYAKLNTYEPNKILLRNDFFSFLNIPRLQKNELLGIDSLANLTAAYTTIINSHTKILHDSILDAGQKYGYLLALTSLNQNIIDALAKLDQAIILKDQKYIQYTLDMLSDATQTFNEFADEAYLFMRACKIKLDSFPRHLTLGRLTPVPSNYYDLYRTVFFNVPPVDAQDHHLENAKVLFEKMLKLVISFKATSTVSNNTENIKITPDGTAQQLFSERSVPYYYDNTKLTDLIKFWNPEKTLRGREKERYGYFSSAYSASSLFTSPFSHSLNQLPMLRIEGVAGFSADIVKQELENQKLKYNLNFDVKLLRLEDAGEDLNTDYDCESDDLQADYLQVREEIICCVKELQEILDLQDSPFDFSRINRYLKTLPGFDYNAFEMKFIKPYKGLISKKHFDIFTLLNLGINPQGPEMFVQLANVVTKMHSLSSTKADQIFATLLPSLKTFKYSDFIPQFKSLIYLSVQYRTYFELVLETIEYFLADIEMKTDEEKQLGIYRDIITRLQMLDCSCIYSKLEILEELRSFREQKRKDAGLFKNFIQYVKPGLEHYAAVPRDGTIYLVYTNQPVYNANVKNQVIADFALGGTCCDSFCGAETVIDQPIITNTNEFLITRDEMIAKGLKTITIEILGNDYLLCKPSDSLTNVEIVEIASPSSYLNIGSVTIDKSTKTQKVIYANPDPKLNPNTPVTPTIDFFLFKISYTISNTDPNTKIVSQVTYVDYSTLRVIVKGNAIQLINTKPDKAATMIGRKVNIDLLANDNTDFTRSTLTVSLVDATGVVPQTKPYLSELGNVVELVPDKSGLLNIAKFDSAYHKTKRKILDTITDRFYYIVSDTKGNTSLTTFVDVDILPCCNEIFIFHLPKYEYCKNSPPDIFFIEAPDYTAEQLTVEGPGVSRSNGQWQFDPSSLSTSSVMNAEFILYGTIDTTKTELARFSVDLFNPIGAEFVIGTENPSSTYPYGRYIFRARQEDADLYEWFIGKLQIGMGFDFEIPIPFVSSFDLTLRTRKFFGTDCFCTTETTQHVERIIKKNGLKIYNAGLDYIDPGDIYKTNNSYAVKIGGDTKFIAEATKSNLPVVEDLKSFTAKFDDVISNPATATKVIDGSSDAEIMKAGTLLDNLATTAGSITDTTLSQDVTKAYSGTAVNALVLIAMRGTDTKTGTPMSDTLGKVIGHLTTIAKANKLTASDKQMLDNAYNLAANKPELQMAIANVKGLY